MTPNEYPAQTKGNQKMSEGNAVELYHFWSSVCSVKVRMCLEEKGVPWTSRYIDLFRFDQMQPEYLKLNPDGVVPTLVHGGEPVRESSIIAEYIDDGFEGPALKPRSPLARARMREFIRLCDDGLPAIVLPTMVKYILPKLRNRWSNEELARRAEQRPTEFYKRVHRKAVDGGVSQEELAECFAKLDKILDRMEEMLAANGEWIVGEFSLADIAVAPYLFRLSALGEERFWSRQKRPHVADWYKRILGRKSFEIAASWPDETGGGYEEVGLKASLPTSGAVPAAATRQKAPQT
jgi:glutathione S-transferase